METSATVQDESQPEKDLKKETSKINLVGNVKAEYRVNKDNWSFKPIGDANPKVVLLTFDDIRWKLPKPLSDLKYLRFFS
ncbi:hypothetical protein [Peribacillus sp. NJ4]|uniref:hypothetical protein n=1 Tax=Peribacillus sp. NJ4 TaxID=3055862 RepID=UPI00338E0AA0